MTSDLGNLSGGLLSWAQQNWEILAAVLAILILGLYVRRALGRGSDRPRAVSAVRREPVNSQALDVSVAAASEVAGDIEAYARALFAEDWAALAARAAGGASQPLRFAAFAEAPFIYDGVIMRDLTLLPTHLIGPVSAHFRHAQTILDALRRQAALSPPDAAPEERLAALNATAAALVEGIERAVAAAEKLDAWIAKNGSSSDGARALADLPVAALKGASVDRLSQRGKTYKILREQAQARLAEIGSILDAARRTGGPGGKLDMTLVAIKPDERRNGKAEATPPVKPAEKREEQPAAE